MRILICWFACPGNSQFNRLPLRVLSVVAELVTLHTTHFRSRSSKSWIFLLSPIRQQRLRLSFKFRSKFTESGFGDKRALATPPRPPLVGGPGGKGQRVTCRRLKLDAPELSRTHLNAVLLCARNRRRLLVCLSARLPICLPALLSVCLPFCPYVFLPVCLCLPMCLSIFLPVCLLACPSVCLLACLSACFPRMFVVHPIDQISLYFKCRLYHLLWTVRNWSSAVEASCNVGVKSWLAVMLSCLVFATFDWPSCKES